MNSFTWSPSGSCWVEPTTYPRAQTGHFHHTQQSPDLASDDSQSPDFAQLWLTQDGFSFKTEWDRQYGISSGVSSTAKPNISPVASTDQVQWILIHSTTLYSFIDTRAISGDCSTKDGCDHRRLCRKPYLYWCSQFCNSHEPRLIST